MAAILSNFRNTILLSLAIALIFLIGYGMHYEREYHGVFDLSGNYVQAVLRWGHTVSGILWIGLLYYFNFVQIRKMPEIPAELKPAVSKYIAPEALFWFRYAALSTIIFGWLLAWNRGYLVDAYMLGSISHTPRVAFIGVGMWLATIMFINVWVFIWPNQKIALGIVEADADAKAKAARLAMLFSRTNTLLSIPMLTAMTMNQTIFG